MISSVIEIQSSAAAVQNMLAGRHVAGARLGVLGILILLKQEVLEPPGRAARRVHGGRPGRLSGQNDRRSLEKTAGVAHCVYLDPMRLDGASLCIPPPMGN